jgi:hypothetical protein
MFFTKPSHKNDVSVCGWHKCDKKEYAFRALSKRRTMMTPAQISARMTECFCSSGWGLALPRNIANINGQTDLIVAGVQMYDDVIHQHQQIREEKVFVAQPSVRMQFQPSIETEDGISTSFVNVCTESMGGSLDEHLRDVDHWCTVLSMLGLHMNDFVIIMRVSENDWGTGKFPALGLFFSYGGLELGDAGYFLVPQQDRGDIPISDIGFGLERIAWAINKTDSYFDTLVPLTVDGSKEMFDSCRTLALLVCCGVQASNKGPGLQFRRFAKLLSEKYYGKDLYSALSYYFDYWSQFVKPSIDRGAAVQLVRLEVERFINIKIREMLKCSPPQVETTEAYLARLVYTHRIDIREIHKAIQACKT